jgi:hypothetical protein
MKLILTIFLFLCVAAISVFAFILGDSFDMFDGEALTFSKQFECETNIGIIDSIRYYLTNSKHPEPLIHSKIKITKDHFLFSILSDSKLNENEKITKLISIQDSLKIRANLLSELGKKQSKSIPKRGKTYFIGIWLLFIIPILIIRTIKKIRNRKRGKS